MTDGQQNWVYRTDLTAQVLRPEHSCCNEAEIPPDVSERVLTAIAKQVRVPDGNFANCRKQSDNLEWLHGDL